MFILLIPIFKKYLFYRRGQTPRRVPLSRSSSQDSSLDSANFVENKVAVYCRVRGPPRNDACIELDGDKEVVLTPPEVSRNYGREGKKCTFTRYIAFLFFEII